MTPFRQAQAREDQPHHKACVALANKLARTLWAVWRYERAYDPEKGLALAPSV